MTRRSRFGVRPVLRWLLHRKSLLFLRRRLMTGVEVREAAPEDMGNILDDLSPHTPDAYFDDRPCATNFIAVHRRRILGVVQLIRYPIGEGPFEGHWLMGLYVWPRYRGLGIGALLTRAVIERSRSEGADVLSLLVWEDNLPAVALYHGMRFRATAIPGLEEGLAAEKQRHGRRRVAYSLDLKG